MPSLAATAKRAAYSLLAIALILAGLLAWIRYSITQPVICAPACTGVNLSGRSLQNAQLRAKLRLLVAGGPSLEDVRREAAGKPRISSAEMLERARARQATPAS